MGAHIAYLIYILYARQYNARLVLFWAPFFDETLAQKWYKNKKLASFYEGASSIVVRAILARVRYKKSIACEDQKLLWLTFSF